MAQVTTNDKMVETRARIGRYATTASLIIIIAPLVVYLPRLFSSSQDLPVDQLLILYGALLVGFVLSNIGGYFMSRFGTKQFEKVNAAIKGLDKRYRLYNYLLPSPNTLLTPFGVTILLVKNVEGAVYANGERWRQDFSLVRILRWFSSEGVGNPPRDLQTQEEKMENFLAAKLGEDNGVPVDGYIVFTNPKAQLNLENTAAPVIALNEKPDALKEALRKDKKATPMPKATYDKVADLFDKEAAASIAKEENRFSFLRRGASS